MSDDSVSDDSGLVAVSSGRELVFSDSDSEHLPYSAFRLNSEGPVSTSISPSGKNYICSGKVSDIFLLLLFSVTLSDVSKIFCAN